MLNKKNVKNAVDLLTGKTAEALNRKFILFAGRAEPGYAKLTFKSDETTYYEDADKPVNVETPYNGALVPEGADLKDLNLPSQVLMNYKRAQKAKDEIEAMGILDVKIGYSNAACVSKNGGSLKRVHEFFIVFPIDNKHKQNRLVARSMAKHDRDGVNYYEPGKSRIHQR